MTKPDESRLDSQGRDVTHLPGLWSEDDKIIKGEPMTETSKWRQRNVTHVSHGNGRRVTVRCFGYDERSA